MDRNEKVVVFIEGIICKEVNVIDAMNWVWSEENTEEHPLHIYNQHGNEIEW